MSVCTRSLSRFHFPVVPEKRLLILHSSKRNLRTVFHPRAHKQRLTDNYFRFTALMSRNIVINAQLLHPRFCRPGIFQTSAPLLLFAYGGCVVREICHCIAPEAEPEERRRIGSSLRYNRSGRDRKFFVGIRKRRFYSNAGFNVYN